jgi:hypothetical protein
MKVSQKLHVATDLPRPALMIGRRRCGSHLIRLSLGKSPEFYSPYPLHIIDLLPLVPLYGDLNNDDNYFQLILDVIGLHSMNVVKWPAISFEPISIFDAIKTKPRSVHTITWEMLIQAGRIHNAAVVMDKSLDTVLYGEHLIKIMDDILFLHVIRDPRGQVASMTRAIIHDFDPVLNAISWKKAQDAAEKLAEKYPGRVLTIRYEDFLSDIEVTVRKITSFFNIKFLPEMVDTKASDEAKLLAKQSALWGSNAKPPVLANIAKYREFLTLEQIEQIETICGDYMDKYNYKRETKANALISDEIIAQAKLRSNVQKQMAWDKLKNDNIRDYQTRKQRAWYIAAVHRRLLEEENKNR